MHAGNINNECSQNKLELFRHVLIQTNNLCTRKCPWCYFGQEKDKRTDIWLDEKVVFQLINELKKINFKGRLGFFEINEPLTDPRIFAFIKYAKQQLPDNFHMLITNGDLLTKRKLFRLFHFGLDKLLISVYDKKMLNKMSIFNNYIPHFFDSGKIEILNFINTKMCDNRGGNIEWKNAPTPTTPLQASCDRVHNVIYVRPTGKVVSCFSDFYEINVMGDVKKESLSDIWFGKKFQHLRNNLDNKNREFSPLCSYCNYPGKGWFYNHLS